MHGVSIAYHLTKQQQTPVSVTVVERSSVAAAASGKAGGFLAREWGNGPTVQLHRQGFDLHEKLAKELNIQSFRRIDTLSVDGSEKGPNVASWLDRTATSTSMGTPTAQVTPLELTTKLWEAAAATGHAALVRGVAAGVQRDATSGRVTGVVLADDAGTVLPADALVVALGPWAGVFCEDHFPGVVLPMEGIKSTSIVYNNVEHLATEPYALFCAEDVNGCHLELYPRHDLSLYVCGCGGSDYVKGDRLRAGGDCFAPEQIEADPRRIAAATRSIKSMSSLGDKVPDIAQACMRPCLSDGLPAMGEIESGVYVSAGHNCWGILWGPVAGLAMAELIATGQSTSIDLTPFHPLRFSRMGTRGGGRGKKAGGTVPVGEQW